MSDLPARVWLTGYGNLLAPRMPFEVARLSDERIVLAHHGVVGVRQVMVAPDPSSDDPTTTRVALGRDTTSVSDVLAFVETTDHARGWSLVTREWACGFPQGTTLWSTPIDAGWPFELIHTGVEERDAIVYVQGPWARARAPLLERLVSNAELVNEGGRPLAHGTTAWVELRYQHEDVTWTQRRELVAIAADRIVLVTAQARLYAAAAIFAAADEVATTLRARE